MNPLRGRPLLTSVAFVTVGALPLYLSSAQLVSLDGAIGFDAARLGVATALYFGLAALAAQPVGATVARIGARNGLRIGAFLSLGASSVAAAAGVWWLILGALGVAGLSNAFMQVSSNVMLSTDVAPDRQGVSFGAKQGAIPLASALAGALLPSVGVAVGWRWPYVVAVGLAALAMLAAPTVRDESARASERERRGSLSKALRYLAIGGACGGAAGNGLALFVVPSAVDIGNSEAVAGTVLAVGSFLVLGVRIGAGAIADRTRSSGHREMATLLGLGSAASLALVFVDSAGWYLVAMPLALVGAWGWPGLAYFAVVRIHPEAAARASGVVLASNLTGTVVGPLVVGQLANRGAYSWAWAFCSALAFGASAFMLVSWRSFRGAPASPSASGSARRSD